MNRDIIPYHDPLKHPKPGSAAATVAKIEAEERAKKAAQEEASPGKKPE